MGIKERQISKAMEQNFTNFYEPRSTLSEKDHFSPSTLVHAF